MGQEHLIREKIISTHALTEGDLNLLERVVEQDISTHALTEGDAQRRRRLLPIKNFNSRPHGGRPRESNSSHGSGLFQLTPSRRATHCSCSTPGLKKISTHALTEGDVSLGRSGTTHGISTHALTEGDDHIHQSDHRPVHFNSRPHGGRRQI